MSNKPICVALLSCFALGALATDGPVPAASAASATTPLLQEFSQSLALSGAEPQRGFTPPGTDGRVAILRDPTLQAELEKAVLRYEIGSMEHRRRALEWQHVSGVIIFWVVNLAVLCGLIFSGMQFRASLLLTRHRSDGSETEAAAIGTRTDVEFSTSGIKVSSPVIGVLILSISLVFFYLYLVHVYKISEIAAVAKVAQDFSPVPG